MDDIDATDVYVQLEQIENAARFLAERLLKYDADIAKETIDDINGIMQGQLIVSMQPKYIRS